MFFTMALPSKSIIYSANKVIKLAALKINGTFPDFLCNFFLGRSCRKPEH